MPLAFSIAGRQSLTTNDVEVSENAVRFVGGPSGSEKSKNWIVLNHFD